jgi:hypothetical protein
MICTRPTHMYKIRSLLWFTAAISKPIDIDHIKVAIHMDEWRLHSSM